MVMACTIFITIFEGIESKNILRTTILPTLLQLPDIRIVLFVKNEARMHYHQKEWHDPRIRYAVVGTPSISGWDRVFMKLKFLLLRTETTALRRTIRYESDGNWWAYYGGNFLSWFLARPAIRRAVRALDFLLVRNSVYTEFFARYHPDLVLCANLFDEPELHLLREAKRRGVRTIGFVNSWDKATARCMLRLLPDKMIVFNEMVKDDLVRHHDVREEDIFVGGIPQYDSYFSFRATPREDFFRSIDMDPQKKLIVYSPVGSMFGHADWDMIDLLYQLKNEGKFGSDVELFLRFPPNEFIDQKELKTRPFLKYTYPGVRFSEKRGIDWDMTFPELQDLANTLHHMSLIICYASSIGIDAAVFDKPVINLNFEARDYGLVSRSPSQFNRMYHYQKALQSGGIRLVNNEDELVYWVRKYLHNSHRDAEGRARLVKSQCVFLDGKSGERIGKFIISMLPKK